MNKCKDCKFWGKNKKGNEMVPYKELRQCGALEWTDHLAYMKSNPIAVTVAYEESALMTKEDFGCVLFEEK